MTFRERYTLQRKYALVTFGDGSQTGGVREPNMSVDWAGQYWSEWSRTAVLWRLEIQGSNPYGLDSFDAELARFRGAEDAMTAPGPDGKLIRDPALFWLRIAKLAFTMDALGAAPDRLTTQLEILGATAEGTIHDVPGAVINGTLAVAGRLFGTLAPWILAGGVLYLAAEHLKAR